MGLKPIRDSHGRTVDIEFKPTLKMHKIVVEMNKAENQHLSPMEILKICKVSEREWNLWKTAFVIHNQGESGEITSRNYFEEWFENALQIRSGEEREMLRQVGLQKAMEGNFNFWQAMSKTYGAMSDAPVPDKNSKISFSLEKGDVPIEQVDEVRRKLLESHRSVGDSGGSAMVRLTAKGQKG